MKVLNTDILIVGGGTGGVAAALSAAARGFRVVVTESSDWLGGQLTSQAVPPDEHPWIETHGSTRLYRCFRKRVRQFYQRNYPLNQQALEDPCYNPGLAGVSTLSHEPRIAAWVLEEMLAPHVSAQHLHVLRRVEPVAIEVQGGEIRRVVFHDIFNNDDITIEARFVLDATETGDLLPLGKIPHVTGAEGSAATGEMHAVSQEPRPGNVQALTWVAALGYDSKCPEGCDRHHIEKPQLYDFWKTWRPPLNPPWPGSLLDWSYTNPFTLQPTKGSLFPFLWKYRRILASQNFAQPEAWNEASILNWPQNDYMEHDVILCSLEERLSRLERARQLTLSMVYWLQTEAPRPDGGAGFSGLHLRPDATGTRDGLAKEPYIRESRRIRAATTITENDVGVAMRNGLRPEPVKDAIGTGYYRIDLHPTTGGDNYVDIESFPFQIPLGALISPAFTNFLPAAKNIGTTHVTNGCFRLHPVEWSIGESAGALAAFCLARGRVPQEVRSQEVLFTEFQNELRNQGVDLAWPEESFAPQV